MAAGGNPPIIDTAVAAWRDAFRAIGAMPAVTGIAFGITIALAVVSIVMLDFIVAGPGVISHILTFLLNIINAVLIAPLAIAVHRYVLLGEVTGSYSVEPSNPRYLRFVSFSLIVVLIVTVPGWIIDALSPTPIDPKTIDRNTIDPKMLEDSLGSSLAILVVVVAILIPIFIVILRRVVLFPAVAVDAAGATWANARQDSKGHTWRILFVFVCVTLPLMILLMPFAFRLDPANPKLTGLMIVSTITTIPMVCAYAAAASHIFRTLANSLAGRPGAALPTT